MSGQVFEDFDLEIEEVEEFEELADEQGAGTAIALFCRVCTVEPAMPECIDPLCPVCFCEVYLPISE